MEIEIFTLADFAQDNHSKLTIVGTFDSIQSKQFPCTHPSCSIATRLRFSAKETGNHDFRLRLIDADGKEMIQAIEGNISIPAPANGLLTSINVVANFVQLKFEKPGRYSFELYIDGEWKSGLPLFLQKTA
jgi:adenine specific DNA methylase Mod